MNPTKPAPESNDPESVKVHVILFHALGTILRHLRVGRNIRAFPVIGMVIGGVFAIGGLAAHAEKPTANYAEDVLGQLADIEGSVARHRYTGIITAPDFPSGLQYLTIFGSPLHINGMAKLDNGFWVVSHSTGILSEPELLLINPFTKETVDYKNNNLSDEGYVSGMQGCGNYLAVGVTDESTTEVGWIDFYEAGTRMGRSHVSDALTKIGGKLVTGIGRVENVGFSYVKNLNKYCCVHVKKNGDAKAYYSDSPANGGGFVWQEVPIGDGLQFGEAGLALIMEGNSAEGNIGYALALGQSGSASDAQRSFSVQKITFSAGQISVEAADYETLPDPRVDPNNILSASFRWGGTAHVNESGRLEILVAPRNLVGGGLATADFGFWQSALTHRKIYDARVVGRIVRVKCITVTGINLESDEVYLATNGDGKPVNIPRSTSQTHSMANGDVWNANLDVVSPSADGTYVYVMEHDGGDSGPDFIGEIFLPAEITEWQQHTVTLTGDDSEYEVVYKVWPPGIVWNTNDSGSGSLRGTIVGDYSSPNIRFDPTLDGQTVTLTSGNINMVAPVKLTGRDLPGTVKITASSSTRIGP